MTLHEICKGIELQRELAEGVLSFAEGYDFSEAQKLTDEYADFSKINDITGALKALLGKDEGNVKILACHLNAACRLYDKYKEKEISDEIFFDTMKCFTRFSGECLEKTCKLAFDREWWTGRQVGLHLFRIGLLEFDLKYGDDPHIGVHIPSDAVLEYNALKASFDAAKEFFAKYFPDYKDCEIRCSTWLFAPEVRERLSETSRIRLFGDFFDLTVTDKKSNAFTIWLFGVEDNGEYENLKEDTSLQRSMKKFLLEGGQLSITNGVLK